MTHEIHLSRKTRQAWTFATIALAAGILATATSVGYYRERIKNEKAAADAAEIRAEKERLVALNTLAEARVKSLTAKDSAYDALHESAHHGYVEISSEHIVRVWNPFMARTTGYTALEANAWAPAMLLPPNDWDESKVYRADVFVPCKEHPSIHMVASARTVSTSNNGWFVIVLLDREDAIVDLGTRSNANLNTRGNWQPWYWERDSSDERLRYLFSCMATHTRRRPMCELN